jgi:hypothetical protein
MRHKRCGVKSGAGPALRSPAVCARKLERYRDTEVLSITYRHVLSSYRHSTTSLVQCRRNSSGLAARRDPHTSWYSYAESRFDRESSNSLIRSFRLRCSRPRNAPSPPEPYAAYDQQHHAHRDEDVRRRDAREADPTAAGVCKLGLLRGYPKASVHLPANVSSCRWMNSLAIHSALYLSGTPPPKRFGIRWRKALVNEIEVHSVVCCLSWIISPLGTNSKRAHHTRRGCRVPLGHGS